MTLRLKNNIRFVKLSDLWGTLQKRATKNGAQAKNYKIVRFKYLSYIKNFLFLSRYTEFLTKNCKLGALFLINRSYFNHLVKKNKGFLFYNKKFLLYKYGFKGQLFFQLKYFKAFLFPKIRERKLKNFFYRRRRFFRQSSEFLFLQFQTMLGYLVMKLGFFSSFYGLQKIMKFGLFKVNDKLITSRFGLFMKGDVLTFSDNYFFLLKKRFLYNLRNNNFLSVLLNSDCFEINFGFLLFLYLEYPKFSSDFPINDIDIRSGFSLSLWLNTARQISRF